MEYVVIAAVIVLAVLVSLALLAPRRRRGAQPVDGRGDVGLLPRPGEESDGGSSVAAPERPRDLAEPAAPTAPVAPDLDAAPAEPLDADLLRLERPEPVAGRLRRLRARLARSQGTLGKGLLTLLSRDRIDEDTWEEVEDTLISSDLGVAPTQELVQRLRTRVRVEGGSPERVREVLREELVALVDPSMDRSLATTRLDGRPAVVLVVGVNGTGKTTTVGKLARVLVAEDKDVVLGAADTFRAAAADQLQTWGDRVGVPVVRADREGADPAAVAYDAVRIGTEAEVDVVVIDTAGRLQNKVGLMDELGKVKRVAERHGPIGEVLLVLDATTGQNGLSQAAVFSSVVAVTGIVLTKLDGTAKGGIVVAVQRQLGVPVKLVGLGEGPDDLAPFDPDAFVDGLLG